MSKKCEICNKWLKNNRGYNIHCNRMNNQKQINNSILEELLNRVRKLELDNSFMKHQLKHKVFVGNSKDSMLDWDLTPEIKEIKNETKIQFNVIVKELKVIFTGDNFDYHNALSPVNNPIEELVILPMSIEIVN